jgi:hypothetical protein
MCHLADNLPVRGRLWWSDCQVADSLGSAIGLGNARRRPNSIATADPAPHAAVAPAAKSTNTAHYRRRLWVAARGADRPVRERTTPHGMGLSLAGGYEPLPMMVSALTNVYGGATSHRNLRRGYPIVQQRNGSGIGAMRVIDCQPLSVGGEDGMDTL